MRAGNLMIRKRRTMHSILRLALAGLWLISVSAVGQPIYRVVDKDGNVTYTDQKPSDDASPIDLPEINVISESAPEVEQWIEPESLPSDIEPFRMTMAEPADGSVIANTEGQIDVRLDSNLDIPPAAQLVIYLNDQPQLPVRTLELTLTGLEPGQYRLHAELQTPSGRKLAETEAITVQLIAVDSS
jgi:hypothetical protein